MKEKLKENSLPYGLNESQLNDLFNMLNSNSNKNQLHASAKTEETGNSITAKSSKINKKLLPKPELLEHQDIDIEKYNVNMTFLASFSIFSSFQYCKLRVDQNC